MAGVDRTHSFLVLAEGSMDDTHIKEDLGGVGDLLELAQCLVELIIIVPPQGGNPRFYFLSRQSAPREASYEGRGFAMRLPALAT